MEFVSYQKSVSASQNKELFEKYGFDGPRNWLDSNQYVKKLKKTVCTCINKIFLDIYLPMNERISFPLKKMSFSTGCNKKDFYYNQWKIKICSKKFSTKQEKLSPMKRFLRNWNKMVSASRKISFR